MLSTFKVLILSTISISLASISGAPGDDFCHRPPAVLCVKDVLANLLSATKQITAIAQKIEQSIYQTEVVRTTLDRYVDYQIHLIRANITSEHHRQFMYIDNNINRTGLIKLIQEENYAFSYLYNSIQTIRKMENTFDSSTDELLKTISHLLHKDVLCNYRSILDVYSATWRSLNEINGIQILNSRRRMPSSLYYSGYCIIISRLLQEWSDHVNDFVSNIQVKIYLSE